jgi:hypothetical protein
MKQHISTIVVLFAVTFLSSAPSSAEASEPKARMIPKTIHERCRPMPGKADVHLRGGFEQIAETLGKMACVQFQMPHVRMPVKQIELPKQKMTTEETLKWFEGLLADHGYVLVKVSEQIFRIEEISAK